MKNDASPLAVPLGLILNPNGMLALKANMVEIKLILAQPSQAV